MADEGISLATLWVPVMPEVRGFNEAMRTAGVAASAHLAEGMAGAEVGMNLGSQIGSGLLQGLEKTGVTGKLTGLFGNVNLASLGVAAGIAGIAVAAEKLGESLLNVGEKFEDINRDIAVFTGATGPALDELKEHADNLVSSLDTSTKNLGVDMATIATRLGLTGDALDTFTRHVEELRDRFGSLDIDKLTGALLNMGVAGADADNVFASLMLSAQAASEPINTLINDMAKAAPVAKDLGITAEQLGALLTGLHAKGEDAGAGVDILQRAMGKAKEKGMDLHEYLVMEANQIKAYAAAGNTAAAEAESNDVFGTRHWAEALDAIEGYLKVLDEGPDKYKANGTAIDDMTARTQTLENQWHQVANAISHDVQPAADALLDAVVQIAHALDWVLNQRFGFDDQRNSGPPLTYTPQPGVPLPPGPGAPPSGGPGTAPAPKQSQPPSIAPWDTGGTVHTSGYSASGTDWDAIAQGESSGNWFANTGNGFYGGLQFTQSTWDAYKPAGAPARADQASRQQQIDAAEATLRVQGPGAWPNTYHLGAPGASTTGATTTGAAMPSGASVTYTPAMMASLGIAPLATNPASGNPVLPQWLQDFAHTYGGPGLTATSTPHGDLHGTPGSPDWATDIVGPQDQQDRLASYLLAHPELSAQMIHQSASGQPMGVAGGVDVSGRYYTTAGGTYGDEAGMVHWAPAGMPSGAPISATLAGYGTPAGLGPGGSPYVSGTGETQEQQRQRQRAIDNAQDRVDSSKDQVDRANDAVAAADSARNAAEAHVQKLRDAGGKPGTEEFDKAHNAAIKAEHDYAAALNERTAALHAQKQAGEDLTDAQQKQVDEGNKPAPTSESRGRSGGYGAAEELGSGLLGGLMSSIGLPDVFGGKSPLDFGSVKLGMGLLNWGLSGVLGGMHKQAGGGQFGLPGANIVGPPGSPVGQAPGPPNAFNHTGDVNVDNSVNVHTNVPASDVAAWQSAANSQQRAQQTAAAPGAFPVQ